VFFCNSGAEANECAIKLARRYGQTHGGPERYHVVSAYGSFHGRTLTTLAATGQPQKQEVFQPLPSGFRQVTFGDLDALTAAMDERVTAVMLEAIQGEGGVIPSPPGYLEAVRTLCTEREALMVVDEVQAGLGRTGEWFGFQHADGVEPDIVTMAKALGNGVPIGACWARAEVAAAFKPGDHATTFGGQPLAARAALATLEVMEAEDAPALARRAGERLTKALLAIPAVADVRGAGLLLAAELAPGVESGPVAAACLDAGLVVNAVTPTALRLEPPLLVTDEEIDAAATILERVLADLGAAR
jgi:acetylornithine/succinyldiaminopimelate/putrescine aminotransferase